MNKVTTDSEHVHLETAALPSSAATLSTPIRAQDESGGGLSVRVAQTGRPVEISPPPGDFRRVNHGW